MSNYKNDILNHYGIEKTAGGTGWPLTSKEIKVGPRRIKKVCYDSGAFDNDYLDGLDWRKVEFDKPIPNPHRSNGTLVWWRVYPVGEFGNKRSEYVYGFVMTEWKSGAKGVEIEGDVVVKH